MARLDGAGEDNASESSFLASVMEILFYDSPLVNASCRAALPSFA